MMAAAMGSQGLAQILGGIGEEKGNAADAGDINNGMDWMHGQIRDAEGNFKPYQQAGDASLNNLSQFLRQYANPQEYINNIMSNWKMSPQAQLQLQQGQNAMNAGAAVSGRLGSGAEQKSLGQFNNQIVNADQQQWFNNNSAIADKYTQGQQGIAGMGLQADQSIMSALPYIMDSMKGMYGMQGGADENKILGKFGGLSKMMGGASTFMPGGGGAGGFGGGLSGAGGGMIS